MLTTDPLFVGCTRPTMVGGVTYHAFGVNAMLTAIIFIGTSNIFYIAFGIPLHGFFYLLCKNDARIFELLQLWSITKGRNLNRRLWNSSSYSPLASFRELAPVKKKGQKSK